MRQIAHIVNPFRPVGQPQFPFAQQVTLETMRAAQAFAAPEVDVRLFSAQYPEDASGLPADFTPTPPLERSILDLGAFAHPRKLPLLADILERLYTAAPHAETLIYTNADIALLPHFYRTVNRFIDKGLDAFVINRRTISDGYTSLAEIPVMYSETGQMHEGFDCFVFRREALPSYDLGDIAIGAPGVGRLLLWNMLLHAANFHLFTTNHLTFHLGNDTEWAASASQEYASYNWAIVRRFYDERIASAPAHSPVHAFIDDVRAELGLPISLQNKFRRTRSALLGRLTHILGSSVRATPDKPDPGC